ncbi:MAG: DUF1295 domain-containing protein, partial [Actinomycetota bacterium]|nr:DUF1295 domain-containing protein [Actinomycetota bacterium]
MSGLWLNLAATAVAVVVLMAATFAISLRRGKWDTIDTVWGLGFAVVAVVSFALSDGSLAFRLVVTLLTVAWGVRLAVHLHRRNHGKPDDRRYAEILSRAKGNP